MFLPKKSFTSVAGPKKTVGFEAGQTIKKQKAELDCWPKKCALYQEDASDIKRNYEELKLKKNTAKKAQKNVRTFEKFIVNILWLWLSSAKNKYQETYKSPTTIIKFKAEKTVVMLICMSYIISKVTFQLKNQ